MYKVKRTVPVQQQIHIQVIFVDKPTDFGVVVSALEIVELGFRIVVVRAVAEGVD